MGLRFVIFVVLIAALLQNGAEAKKKKKMNFLKPKQQTTQDREEIVSLDSFHNEAGSGVSRVSCFI